MSARTFGNVRRPILGDVTLWYVGFKTGFLDYLVILATIIEFKQIEFSDITRWRWVRREDRLCGAVHPAVQLATAERFASMLHR